MSQNTSNNRIDDITVETLYDIANLIASNNDWKAALDEVAHYIRPIFIFDNLVIYRDNPEDHNLDVFYARAMGRGRSAEADIAWGEALANQVIVSCGTILQEPTPEPNSDRLDQPYILGIPLKLDHTCLGTIIFIRFGGPPFSKKALQLAHFLAIQATLLVQKFNFEAQIKDLQTATRQAVLQENFINIMSHELLHPLGFIKGYATTLMRSEVEWDKESQREFLRIIDEETDKLQELISNLLDSARLQSGQMRMEFQFVRLDSMIHDIITRYTAFNPNIKIEVLSKQKLLPIVGDPLRLTQVIENLLNNAQKYAPGAPIRIKIDQNNQGVELVVTDYGPGISPEHLPHIFERFYRIPGKAEELHGSGLGLFICKEIVEAHHGSITASSELGKGTTFTLLLPYQP